MKYTACNLLIRATYFIIKQKYMYYLFIYYIYFLIIKGLRANIYFIQDIKSFVFHVYNIN